MEENQLEIKNLNSDKNRPSKWLIVLLNVLCPGLGFIYCNNIKKAILFALLLYLIPIFFFIFLLLLPETINIICLAIFIPLQILFIVSYSLYFSKRKILTKNKNPLQYVFFILSVILFNYLIFIPVFKDLDVETFRIPTGSMEKTLLVGDYILANKSFYGIHFPFSNKYFIEFHNIKRNDLVIFYYPGDRDELNYNEKNPYIKRIAGLPGDTVFIEDKKLFINGEIIPNPPYATFDNVKRPSNFVNPRLFPKNSKWNEDWYGPIYIPKKGDRLKIDSLNFIKWEVFVTREGYSIKMKNNKIYVDNSELVNGEYPVEKDYLFLMGDNRNNSLDSRFFGLVPVENIIGKCSVVYWSWDLSIPFIYRFGSIRWDRIGIIPE